MICLALGLGVLGFMAMRRARHCHGYAGQPHSAGWRGWHGRHHHHQGRSGGRRSWMLHAALARIDASPAQERAIVGEVEKLGERMYGARTSLDDAALGAVLGQVDATTAEARTRAAEES